MRTGRPRTKEFYVSLKGYKIIRLGKGQAAKHVPQHVFVAEQALGKPLPHGAQVHHVDLNKGNNANANLVICQDQLYHKLLHLRTEALWETGDQHKRRCGFCGEFDSPIHMSVLKTSKKGFKYYHRICKADHELPRILRERPYKERPSRWLKNAHSSM